MFSSTAQSHRFRRQEKSKIIWLLFLGRRYDPRDFLESKFDARDVGRAGDVSDASVIVGESSYAKFYHLHDRRST